MVLLCILCDSRTIEVYNEISYLHQLVNNEIKLNRPSKPIPGNFSSRQSLYKVCPKESELPSYLRAPAGRVRSCAAFFYLQSIFCLCRMFSLLKLTARSDQQISIKCCFNFGKKCEETIEIIQKALRDDCMDKTQIEEWYKRRIY